MTEREYNTLEELQNTKVSLTSYFEWEDLARSIDGYTIFKELGLLNKEAVHGFWLSRKRAWTANGNWKLPLEELLLVLFMEWRKLRFVTGGENYEVINSLLIEIAELTSISYKPDINDQELVDRHNQKEVTAFFSQFRKADDEKEKPSNADIS